MAGTMTSLAIDTSASRVQERTPTPRLAPQGAFVVEPVVGGDFTGGTAASNVGVFPGDQSGLWDGMPWVILQQEQGAPDRTFFYTCGPNETKAILIATGGSIAQVLDRDEFNFMLDPSANVFVVAHDVVAVWRQSPRAVSVVTKAGEVIDELTGLSPGWDGYSGVAVLPEVADHARDFLRTIGEYAQLVPDVVPLSDGGLQLEWFVGDYEVEVEISPDCSTHFTFECKRDGRNEEHSLGAIIDPTFLATYFNEIRR